MFRYIALAWDTSDTAAGAAAAQFNHQLLANTDWHSASSRPGLHVATTGERARVNGSHVLAAGQGVVVGKLFRRDRLAAPSASNTILDTDDSHQIQQTGGRALIEQFWGRYVAFIPQLSGATRVIRDPSGTLPCYLLQHRGVWIVFSWLEDVLSAFPQLPSPTVDWAGLVAHLSLGEIGGSGTALVGISQVLAGQAVDLLGTTETRELLWSAPDFARSPVDLDATSAALQLRETVQGCVRSWASCYDSLLLRLSGGVDSSIVLSCLTREATSARVTCLNFHTPGTNGDERSYARLAATRAQRTLIEMEPDSSFRLDRILEAARTPAPVGYMGRMGTARIDASVAQQCQAAALFTGGGGDQLLFEFKQWWPAADYLHVRGFDAGFLPAALNAAHLGKLSLWRTMRLAMTERLRPSAPQFDLGNKLMLVRPGALPDPRLQSHHLHPALTGRMALPVGKLTQTQQLMHPLGYYDPFELEAAPELVNPLLSQPLVELALRLPTYLLAVGGRGRGLARRAFADGLPPEIAARRSKGGMEDHVKQVLDRNLAFARGMLMEGTLMREGFLDRQKVDDLLSDRPTTGLGRIGELHMLIGIEAWLSRWTHQARSARA